MLGDPRRPIRVDDAEVVTLGRREWVALHTPGHTPDHLCLLRPRRAASLLSGDHVLPTITPHISGIGADRRPAGRVLRLARPHVELDGVAHVLPAHGHPFDDLAGRVDDIKRPPRGAARAAAVGLGRARPRRRRSTS